MNLLKLLIKNGVRVTYGHGINAGQEVRDEKALDDVANSFLQLILFIEHYEKITKGNSLRAS